MGSASGLCLALALLAPHLGTAGRSAAPGPGDVACGAPDAAADERVEHFALESPDGARIGHASWRRRVTRDGVQLERRLRFPAPDEPGGEVGLSQVECLETQLTRLVHREVGRGGRVVLAEWEKDRDGLRAFEWSACGVRREVLATTASAALPLYLCELAREGRLASGRVGCFDPLAQEIATLDVRTLYTNDPARAGGAAARTVELRRADGTLFLRLCFEGAELGAFQLQEGGPWARRAPAPPEPGSGSPGGS